MKWSNDQLKAIEESGKSILVSAGAGSGKTTVLTERLLRKIENGVKIQDLIVLTFTVMASKEMKERLREALTKSSNPLCKEQLTFIDEANIETFDAFTNELVRKYHYLIDIPSSFNIVNSNDFLFISMDIMKNIFLNHYEEGNKEFLKFIDKFSVKNDSDIIDDCLRIYNKLRLNPEYLKIIDNYESLYDDNYIDDLIRKFINNIKIRFSNLNLLLDDLKGYTSDLKLNNHYDKLYNQLIKIIESESYDEIFEIKNIKLPSIPTKVQDEDEKKSYVDIYSQLKKEIENIKKYLIYQDELELRLGYVDTLSDSMVVVGLLKELDVKLKEYKKNTCSYDFTDIALMAIQIVKENSDIRNALSNKTCEILIDEYQDTSDLQENLINLICKNNVYMVGDIKQSIYRFRNANPHIFKSQYQNLKLTPPNLVIDLSQNYRSRTEVISAVNEIFSKLMSENIGGVDYNDAHFLHYGFTYYDSINEENYKMQVYTYKTDSEDLKASFTKEEIEAFIIAKDILNKVKKFKVYHKSTKKYEFATYADFAILVPDKTKMTTYSKVFEYFGIPLKTYQDIVLTKNNDIYAIVSLMKLIYIYYDKSNTYYDIKETLVSTLRSFIINLDDEEVFKIATSSNIYSSFKLSLPDIYNKCIKITKKIDMLDLTGILDIIIKEFKVYEKMLTLPNVSEVEYRINYLFQITKNLSNLNYTFKEMLDYLANLISNNDFEIKIPAPISENNNIVSMMTIHASKGLEFPICYFPELYKKFNFKEMKEMFLYSKDYQLILPYLKDNLLKKNFTYFLEKDQYTKEEISERIRLFYVALTRPREQIVLILPTEDKVSFNHINDVTKMNYTSFKSMLDSIDSVLEQYKEVVNLNNLGLTKDYLYAKVNNKIINFDTTKLTFDNVKLESKELENLRASFNNVHYYSKDELNKMKLGTNLHKLLEIVDFNNPSYYGLTKKEQQLLRQFLEHPFIKNLSIIDIYREYHFITKDNKDVVNGIIDLIIETKDAYYIIDYKLSDLDKAEYVRQLSIYKNYLSGIVSKPVYTYLYSILEGEFKKITI